jgi:hypothetical protein
MTYLATPKSATYSGWYYDAVNSRMNLYYRGTKVGHASATELQVDQALDVDGAANFAAEVECAANLHVQSTLEDGIPSVGTDGQQFTSGGAAAVCNWDTA